jgi:hypothetical protein
MGGVYSRNFLRRLTFALKLFRKPSAEPLQIAYMGLYPSPFLYR